MKKILCVLTAFVLLLGTYSALVATASNLGTVVFYDEDDEVATALDGCSEVAAKVTFTPTQNNSAQVIVSHYSADGKLVKVEPIVSVPATAGQSVTYTTPAISVADTDLLKAFCWGSTDTLVPLTNPGIIERDLLEELPTATVTEIKAEDADFALNFTADEVTDEQLAFYGDWKADFVFTMNKAATFNADGTRDGYLIGQYDEFGPEFVKIPATDLAVSANTPVSIMDAAGLTVTYRDVVETVKDFDCGVDFSHDFLKENDGLEVSLALVLVNPENGNTYTIAEKDFDFYLPTATVTELDVADITDVALTFALNFKADPSTESQLAMFGDWYADYEIIINKTATFNSDGTCDGYLAGQYDSWSPAWVSVPKMDITLTPGTPLKIMETAAEAYGKPGLKYTYQEVYDRVKDFDCGIYFIPEFLVSNPDLEVTLALKMYNPNNENESFVIGEIYTFTPETIPSIDKFIGKDVTYTHTLETAEANTVTYDFADLFTVIDGVPVDMDNLTVTGATYEDGKITLEGFGEHIITVTDNYYCNIATATITVNAPAAVTKWTAKSDLAYETEKGVAVTKTLGELFGANGNPIKDATVSVTGASSFTKGATWDNGIVTFSGGGTYTVTITDGFYCTATSATVTVTELEAPSVAKFDTKFINHETYLYRVGNQNTVALGSIFKALDGVSVGSIGVEVTPMEKTPSVTHTYTPNTDWTKSTLKFSGTGVVKVTICDEESIPYSIFLEIVDAKNVTTVTSATANNVVLLNDISGGFSVSNGYAFYGNGFTVTCSGTGNPGYKNFTTGFVTVSKGGILDNTRIICDIFPESYLYTSDADGYDYFMSAVLLTDDSTVSNCYIYGARNNIYIGGGNATVKNTVTECGSFANIQMIKSSDAFTVTLEDVTTIQYMTTSPYDTSKNVMGFGVAVGDADTKSNPYIRLKGDFRQYNWVTSDYTSVSNSYAKSVLEVALKESAYQHTINGNNTVNLGIAYITSYPANIIDERTNQAEIPYSLNKVSFLGATGRVYSVAAGSAVTADYRYNPETDGVIPYDCGGNGWYEPQIHPNATLGGQYIANTDGCNQYCYMDSDTLKIMIPAGESMEIDFTKIFNIAKYTGQDLQTKISCIDENGTNIPLTNGKLTFADAKEYTVTYTLTDTIFYNENGEQVPQTVTYTKKLPVSVALKDTSTPNAEFEFDSTKQVIYYNKALLGDKVQFMPFLAGLKIYDYMGETRYLRFDGDDNAYLKVVSATIENLNTTGEAQGYHIITVKLVDGGVLKIDLDVKATSGGSTHSGSIKTNKNIFYVVNDGGTASSGQVWRVYDYEFTGNNGVVVNSGAVTFGTSGVDASSATKPTGTFSATVSATVTYDANGGICGQAEGYQTNYYTTLTLPNPTRYGYLFAGWYTAPYQGSRVGGAGDSYTPSGDVTLYAQWGKAATVTFDATGGNVTPETVDYQGEQIVLPLPERDGYWFTGWYEDEACTKLYGMDGVILNPTKNTTLYAGWSPVYTVTYNATGGSVTPASQDYTGTVLTLPLPSDAARAFAGWYTEEDGGTFIGMGGDTYLPTAHITLYAHWEAPSVVTYDANGGTCTVSSETYMGAPLVLPTPTQTGYTFQGWYTAVTGGTKVGDAGTNYTPNGSITLYAQWVKTPYTITVTTSNATITGVTNGQMAYYGDSFTVTVSFSQNNSKSFKVTDASGNTLVSESAAGTYTFTMPASNVTVSASSSGGCFTADTLITMADGSKKAVKDITLDDTILSYNFFTGETEATKVALLVNHGEDTYPVANLTFSDGTTLKIIADHGVFDYDLNEYVYLTVENMGEYIGHTFVKMNADGYELVTLEQAEKTEKTTVAYSLTSAGNGNAFAEDMLTMAPPGDFYNWIEMGEKLRYDTETFQKDMETYGLYPYEDFKDLVTYEQFIELNGAYLKIPVEKGIFTWDYIVELIGLYVNP